jgi:F-type H+-transporting ATPase subunit alpha
VGTSVSRVGSSAQIKAMKEVAGELKLSLAQYREMAAFAEFGTELDEATQRQLARGERMTELLKQDQFEPMPVQFQVVSIYLGTAEHLVDVRVEDISRFEREFHAFLRNEHPEIPEKIAETRKLPEELQEQIDRAVEEFKKTFVSGESEDAAATAAEAEVATEEPGPEAG